MTEPAGGVADPNTPVVIAIRSEKVGLGAPVWALMSSVTRRVPNFTLVYIRGLYISLDLFRFRDRIFSLFFFWSLTLAYIGVYGLRVCIPSLLGICLSDTLDKAGTKSFIGLIPITSDRIVGSRGIVPRLRWSPFWPGFVYFTQPVLGLRTLSLVIVFVLHRLSVAGFVLLRFARLAVI